VTRSVAVHAHRGSPDPATGIAENTVEAFLRAGRLGADGVELDVRLTADGALAVHHDPELPGLGPVAGLRVRDLPDHVPLLGAALDACGELTVNIEIKNLPTEPGHDPDERAAHLVAGLLTETGREHRVVVSSFWPGSLDALRSAAPTVPVGLLVATWFDPVDALARATTAGYQAIHLHESLVGAALVEEAHRTGLSVAAWTVNGAGPVRAAAAAGVDTVITDDVASALGALAVPGHPAGGREPVGASDDPTAPAGRGAV